MHEDLINQIQHLKQRIEDERELSFSHLDMVNNVLPILKNMELVLAPKEPTEQAMREAFGKFMFSAEGHNLHSKINCGEISANAFARYIWQAALSTHGQESESQAVAKIEQTPTGQITIKAGNGDYFDMSKYVGATLFTAPPSALAIESAAKRQAAEVCEKYFSKQYTMNAPENIHEEILATIPQDGITALEELMWDAVGAGFIRALTRVKEGNFEPCTNDEIQTIVSSLIGEK